MGNVREQGRRQKNEGEKNPKRFQDCATVIFKVMVMILKRIEKIKF